MVASKGCFGVSFDCRGVRSSNDPLATWREEFFAYGRSSDRRDTRNRYRFIGVERDEDTGLCMTGPRTYDPIVGRFLQGDPVDGGPPFVYSRGNPIGRRDGNGYADGVTPAVEPTSVPFPDSPLIDPAPPLLSASDALNAPWSVDGVRAVLQTTPEGVDLLSYLDEHQADVQVYSSRLPVTETSFTVVDETGRLEGATLDDVKAYGGENTFEPSVTQGFQHGQTDPLSKNGADTGDVFLDERLSNFEAAVTLYHEVLHVKDPGGPSSISHDQMWQEGDAFRVGLAGVVGAEATPARNAQWDGVLTTATTAKLPADFMGQVRSNATRTTGWQP
jgi:RHS repeat-associated protein